MPQSAPGYHITSAVARFIPRRRGGQRTVHSLRTLSSLLKAASRRHSVWARAGTAPKRPQTTGRKFIHAKPNGDSVSPETRSFGPLRRSWHAFGRPVPRSVVRGAAVHERCQMFRARVRTAVSRAREADAMEPETKKKTTRPRLVLDRRRHPIGVFRIAAFRGSWCYIAACRRLTFSNGPGSAPWSGTACDERIIP